MSSPEPEHLPSTSSRRELPPQVSATTLIRGLTHRSSDPRRGFGPVALFGANDRGARAGIEPAARRTGHGQVGSAKAGQRGHTVAFENVNVTLALCWERLLGRQNPIGQGWCGSARRAAHPMMQVCALFVRVWRSRPAFVVQAFMAGSMPAWAPVIFRAPARVVGCAPDLGGIARERRQGHRFARGRQSDH